MGRSRRRMKKTAPKVKVGVVKRKKNQKAITPQELTEARPGLEKRLSHKATWSEEATLTSNYAANRFVLDPNEGFGRNSRAPPLKSKEELEAEGGETFSDDDGEQRRCLFCLVLCVGRVNACALRGVCCKCLAVVLSAAASLSCHSCS